jgi:hypothetical protein
MLTLEQVTDALQRSWSAYTAFSAEEWSPQNPARGQCVVTALVIQDIFGGELQKLKTRFKDKSESHYRNILPDDTTVDATRSQYPPEQLFTVSTINFNGYPSLREKLFSEANTESRYKLLRTHVLKALS